MRLGKVSFKIEYVVDLDNDEMTEHAKEAICEDVDSVVKNQDCYDWIKIIHDGDFEESDIHSFLLDKEEVA